MSSIFLICLAGSLALSGQAVSDKSVIAEVGGQKLTLGDLEQAMRDRLFQARQQYYSVERAALEQWIDDQVLASEAHRQNLTVDQLLERNIHVIDPTDDQLHVYYEGLNTEQPFEAVREKVLQHIRDLRTSKIRAA